MIDPILDSAQDWNDRMDDQQRRDDWAYGEITDALYGTEKQCGKMLKYLGIPEDEYRDEYNMSPEQVAESHYDRYLKMQTDEAAEYNADIRADR